MATPVTFLEILNPAAIQQAFANTATIKESQNLAVTPKPNVRNAVLSGLQFGNAARQISLNERGLGIARKADRFQRRMAPFAIGIGALEGGVNILQGLRARRLQRQQEEALLRSEQRQEQSLAGQRLVNEELLDTIALRRRRLLAPAASGVLNSIPPLQ